MKTLKQKITAPDGYVIDQEKSTFEEIVFKPIEEEWVDWEGLGKVEGYYITSDSSIKDQQYPTASYHNQNTFPTKQDAESALALAQLLQLRKRVIGDWVADWLMDDWNFVITRNKAKVMVDCFRKYFHELSFPTAEMRDKFLDKYRDLIEIYFKLK